MTRPKSTRILRWRTCPCGKSFYGYKPDCEKCRTRAANRKYQQTYRAVFQAQPINPKGGGFPVIDERGRSVNSDDLLRRLYRSRFG